MEPNEALFICIAFYKMQCSSINQKAVNPC